MTIKKVPSTAKRGIILLARVRAEVRAVLSRGSKVEKVAAGKDITQGLE